MPSEGEYKDHGGKSISQRTPGITRNPQKLGESMGSLVPHSPQ